MNKLLSFHGKQEVKDFYLARVKAHHAADEIVKGRYWEGGKGCAVGCTVHSSSHSDYEDLIGVPRIIARLQDKIFEGMSNDRAKEFPVRFLEDMPVGVDLNNVWRKFLSWLLIDENEGVIKHAKTEAVRMSILNVGNLLEKSTVSEVSKEDFIEVKNAAYNACDADADAAYAVYAAYNAACAAAYAADVYATDVVDSADAAGAYADVSARIRKYDLMAEKLLELIKDAK